MIDRIPKNVYQNKTSHFHADKKLIKALSSAQILTLNLASFLDSDLNFQNRLTGVEAYLEAI